MLSLVIAETQAHARAVMHWLKLDPTAWLPVTYGAPLTDVYLNVLIVRPLTGIREEQGDWFIETVVPRMAGSAMSCRRAGALRKKNPSPPPSRRTPCGRDPHPRRRAGLRPLRGL